MARPASTYRSARRNEAIRNPVRTDRVLWREIELHVDHKGCVWVGKPSHRASRPRTRRTA